MEVLLNIEECVMNNTYPEGCGGEFENIDAQIAVFVDDNDKKHMFLALKVQEPTGNYIVCFKMEKPIRITVDDVSVVKTSLSIIDKIIKNAYGLIDADDRIKHMGFNPELWKRINYDDLTTLLKGETV